MNQESKEKVNELNQVNLELSDQQNPNELNQESNEKVEDEREVSPFKKKKEKDFSCMGWFWSCDTWEWRKKGSM